jgi:hypothetical protein
MSSPMSSGSMSQRLDRELVEVGVGKAGLDTLQEPVEKRRVRDVGGLRLAGEQTPDTSLAVSDDAESPGAENAPDL